MRKNLNITKEWLEEQYVKQQLSSFAIAKLLDCNYMTILNKLKFFEIPIRKDGIKHAILTKEFLEIEYFQKNKSLTVIAKETNSSPAAVRRRFKKYGLQARTKDIFIENKGKQFGQWKIIGRDDKKLKCICSCGKISSVNGANLRNGISTCCKYCKDKKHKGEKHKLWSGYKEISGTMWSRIVSAARKRKIKFSINIEYIWNLFILQNKQCALTGQMIYFASNGKSLNEGKYTASLDRIDSSQGYIEGNVQWVHKKINKIKSNINQKEFITICTLVANFNNRQAIIA